MGWQSPWFLAGLLSVALPLYLHMLRRSQQDRRSFSSLMFFEQQVQPTSRQRKLQYFALLAARLGLLAVIVIAFTGPFFTISGRGVQRQRLTAIVVDRSFSMRAGRSFEAAKAEARRVVNALDRADRGQILALDRHLERVSPPNADRATLLASIDAMQPGDLESSFGELVRGLRVLSTEGNRAVDAHLISDLQRTSMPPDFHDLALGDTVALQTHRVGTGGANWSMESVEVNARIYDPKHSRLRATIAGWATPPASAQVELLLDNQHLDRKPVQVGPDGRASVEFFGFNVPYGRHRGEVRLILPAQDSSNGNGGGDMLAADNRLPFAIERADPRAVLFVYENGHKSEAFFYLAALQSMPESGFKVETATVDQLAGRDLNHYAYLVLHNVGSLDRGLEQKICSWVTGGGAALLALGKDTVSGGHIPLSKTSLEFSKGQLAAGFVDGQSDALRAAGRFENVQFTGWSRWTPSSKGQVLARMADGSPLLEEQRPEEGRLLIFASTFDGAANDFPLHASFVPFVMQTGHYLAKDEDQAATYLTGSTVALRQGNSKDGSGTDVIGPDGERQLSLAESRQRNSFDLTREGFYDIVQASGARRLLAAHANRVESDLRPVSEETLALWRNTGRSGASSTGADGNAKVETVNAVERRQLFPLFLALAIAALLAESGLARRFVSGKSTVNTKAQL